jgi:NDP-sugar pyrophosphorylase family protein
MKAVILAGAPQARLRRSPRCPMPLLQIGHKAILEVQIERLGDSRITVAL